MTNMSDIIIDPFGGSGSTLIACQKLNRKCFMMEIDPHYCDIIIKRWENYTGKKDYKDIIIEQNRALKVVLQNG